MRIDNKKTEDKAVNKVRSAFDSVDYAVTHFNTGNTDISVDGFLEFYRSLDMSAETLAGNIFVQIKGTYKDPDNADSPKVKVAVRDLRNYLDVYNGVIYFKVFSLREGSARGKIYYKVYLPHEIMQTLRKCDDGQNSILERFKPLPNDPQQLRRICDDFITGQKNQRGMNAVGFGSLGEWLEKGMEFDHYELTKTLYAGEIPFSLKTMENGAYVYGVTPFGDKHVIDKIENVTSVEMTNGEHEIRSGEFRELMTVIVGEDERGNYLKFGGFTVREGEPGTLDYAGTGDFRSRLRDAKLARELAKTGCLEIGNAFACKDGRFNSLGIDQLDKRIEVFGRYVSLLDKLAIKTHWDPAELTDKELDHLGMLGAAFISERHIGLDNMDDDLLNLNIDIAGARVKIIAKRDDEGRYVFHNPLTLETFYVIGYESDDGPDEINPIPTFFLLNREDFKMAANLDAERLKESLERYPISNKTSEAVCLKLLDMLHAYDSDAVCGEELLDCCLVVAEGLIDAEQESKRYLINRLQVLYRKGEITANDKCVLRKLANDSSEKAVQASAHILLGNDELAQDCISDLEDDEQKNFYSWPIYNLIANSVE